LFGGLDGDGNAPLPTILATYATGSAHMTITQGGVSTEVELGVVGPGSNLDGMIGASANWRNADGWVLQTTAYEFGFLPEPFASAGPDTADNSESYSGDVVLQRVVDQQVWRADTYATSGPRCIVDIEEASQSELTGGATCRGMRWVDGFAGPSILSPVFIDGQEPFDAEITFEARP
jgi:hypothetical protein